MLAALAPAIPSRDLDECALLRQVRSGDPCATGELYRRLEPEARRYARRLVEAVDVDDVVAESFARILGALRNGGGPRDHAVRYLMVTVRTTAWRTKRRHAGESQKVEVLAREVPMTVEPPTVADPDLARAMAQLAPRHRQAVWLSEVEGVDVKEIGARLGLSPNAAAALTYRARQSLRRAYLAATSSARDDG